LSVILDAATPEARSQLGGKGGALAALAASGLPIPKWFVLSPQGFDLCLSPEQRQIWENNPNETTLRALLQNLLPSDSLCCEIAEAVSKLSQNRELLAVRSSAMDEDNPQHSFAGQLDSFLFVRPAEVPQKVLAVWRSGFSDRILAYRRQHGLSLLAPPPAVLVQRMVNSEVSGVAFSADPVSGRRGIAVIGAVFGIGTGLVSGECDADTYHVDRDGRIVKREVAVKLKAHRYDPKSQEGVSAEAIAQDKATQPALVDEQIREVAGLVRRTASHFGRPQDIEWAYEQGRLYLLQSRPITSLASLPDPDGTLNLWDNSNIAESYSGVTTPLTFSFARYVYEGVYRQFCRIMGVPERAIAAHDQTFGRMLGLLRGRVHYNLLNWYRVLALLPGFSVNRRFMEQMMGVRESLPEDLAAELSRATWREKLFDGLRLSRTVVGLVANHLRIDKQVREFYRRLHGALAPPPVPLEQMRADELAEHYHHLERQLLTRWDAPLVNDFLAMIFHGVLRRLSERWCGDPSGTLSNDLVRGEGGMISTEPADRVRELARLVANDSQFVNLLSHGTQSAILRGMEEQGEFKRHYLSYLEKFGDRCLEELKLESPTLHDDPLLLFRSIGHVARAATARASGSRMAGAGDLRAAAEKRVRQALAGHPLRRVVFRWVLRNARARVLNRENLRFERTRLFGRVRRIFVEMGRRLWAVDLLEEPRDIFYLEVEEILGFVGGTASSANLKGLVALRKSEFAGYREGPAPDDRFETRGIVYHGNAFRSQRAVEETAGEQRSGLGCCPGIVRGPVRVIIDPRHAELQSGSVLVAERTDPGWIMLFPAAAGLLVERGSLLSHSAIVAREMGIPAIVSIPGVTRWLKDGDWVELDGSAGVVHRIAPQGKPTHA